jgi:pilus assembly protein CpaB
MRAKSLILFVIAVGCGLAASIGVSQYMETAGGDGVETETQKILVAMTEINIGETLDAQTVKLEEWPKDRVPVGAVYELEEVEGKYPRTRMYVGEPILVAKLMDSNKNSPTVTIPKGYRAVSIKVSADTAGAGLIQPGDRVDVLVLLRKSSEIPETGTRTILREVNVFSVDGATERSVDDDGHSRTLSTVSLLLKPRQAESVTLAHEMGNLFLTLRRPDDDTEDFDDDGETLRSLLGHGPDSANEQKNDDAPSWLPSVVKDEPQETVFVAETPVDAGPIWKMVILGSEGSREFLWSDETELPTETGDELEAAFDSVQALDGLTSPTLPSTGDNDTNDTTEEDTSDEEE